MKKLLNTVLAMVFVSSLAAVCVAAENSHGRNSFVNDSGDMFSEGIVYQERSPEKTEAASTHIVAASEYNEDMFSEGIAYKEHRPEKTKAAPAYVVAASADRGNVFSEGLAYEDDGADNVYPAPNHTLTASGDQGTSPEDLTYRKYKTAKTKHGVAKRYLATSHSKNRYHKKTTTVEGL